jgi:hypothetical protein
MIRAALIALALAAMTQGAAAARLELGARVVWTHADPAFGGFSGIEVADDGATFTAIGDRGIWATGAMSRKDGDLVDVQLNGLGPLRQISGEALADKDVDAEDLARDPRNGRLFVSFESFHRIREYPDIAGPAASVPGHADFSTLQINSGLEAIAFDADGALYAIPERSGAWERPFPVYRLRDGVWDKRLRLSRSGTFLVAGADFGPDGRLYMLERDFSWARGFATRIRRFTLGPDGFDGGETLFLTDFGSTDNFEGISVWRDSSGATRVTLIADDNFFALQSTVVAEGVLIED